MSLFFRASICEGGHEIRQLEQKRVELSAENTRLTYEIQSKMAFVNLEQKASELGMRKMTRDQVVYIHLYDKDIAVLRDKTVVYGD